MSIACAKAVLGTKHLHSVLARSEIGLALAGFSVAYSHTGRKITSIRFGEHRSRTVTMISLDVPLNGVACVSGCSSTMTAAGFSFSDEGIR